MTPNLFAIFMLLLWPVVVMLLYSALPASRAVLWAFVGAQLLLPVGTILKFEMIPALDKTFVPTVAAIVGCWMFARLPRRTNGQSGLTGILILVYVISPFLSAALNGDVIVFGTLVLPPSGYYDALSAAMSQVIALIPYFLGRAFLRSSKTTEEILQIVVISGLPFCGLLLFEIRMSPQLHRWFYGYVPSDFIQAVRAGGFRPMAFMGHPLLAAFYVMMSAVAATALWRMGRKKVIGVSSIGIMSAFATVLLLCKSLASIVYATVLMPLVIFASPKLQMSVAKVIVCIALLYPVLRLVDVFPTTSLVAAARLISDERADSLKFRFDQENGLLRRASERFMFGWGRFGRNRLYDEETGKDESVTDGRWIITIGQSGLVGFLAEFGLLAMSIFRAAAALRLPASRPDRVSLPALALILSVFVLNLLPNAALLPLTWLLAGSLVGRAEALQASVGRRTAENSGSGFTQRIRLTGTSRPTERQETKLHSGRNR